MIGNANEEGRGPTTAAFWRISSVGLINEQIVIIPASIKSLETSAELLCSGGGRGRGLMAFIRAAGGLSQQAWREVLHVGACRLLEMLKRSSDKSTTL